ncbi:MAG: hypothetical protein WCI57_02430 [Candidatus Berkelbacteria bacterium]
MRTLILAAALLIAAFTASAFGTVEVEAGLANGGETIRFYQATPPNKNGFGTFGFAVISKFYSQAYAGATYSPNQHIWLELGYGLESVPGNSGRIGGTAILSSGQFSLVHCQESGGSGNFNKTVLNYQISPKVTLGVVDDKFNGTGPKVEYKLDGYVIRFVAFPDKPCLSVIKSF